MSEEITETPQETPAEVVETPTEAPAFTDEQVAQALGVDPEFYAKEIKPNAKNFDKMYSKLNARAMAIAEQEKAVKVAPAPEPEVDEDVELDPKAQKALKRFIESEFGGYFAAVQTQTATAIDKVITESWKAAQSLPEPSRVTEIMDEMEMWVKDPTQLEKNFARAIRVAKAESADTDIETKAEALAQERFEKYLEEKGLKDADVVSVKKSPKVENVDNIDWRSMDDPAKKFELLMAKQGMK